MSFHIRVFILEVDMLSYVRAFPIPASCGEKECLGSYANPSVNYSGGRKRDLLVTFTVRNQANDPRPFFFF